MLSFQIIFCKPNDFFWNIREIWTIFPHIFWKIKVCQIYAFNLCKFHEKNKKFTWTNPVKSVLLTDIDKHMDKRTGGQTDS